MTGFTTMFHLQLMLFLFILIGIYVRKKEIVTVSSRKSLTDLVITIILPCNIINSFQVGLSKEILMKSAAILLIAFGAQFLYYFLSKVLYKRIPQEKSVVLQYATICSNAGFMGNPIVQAVYGSEGFLYASIALIPLRIFMWSSGLSLFTKTNHKTVIKNLVFHPCIIAVYIGFILMFSEITLPDFLNNSIKNVGNCNTALSMIVIGTILADINIKTVINKYLLYYSTLRLILIPLLVLIILNFLHVEPLLTGVTVLLAAMPAGSTTAMLAEKYGADSEFASKCVFLSTLLSILTLPFIGMIL